MPSNFSMSVLLTKIARGKRLSQPETEFVEHCFETLKRSYQGSLALCDEAQTRAIVLSEAECELEARRMERDYHLALRLDTLIRGENGAPASPAAASANTGIAYKVCLACYYETQLENMLAMRDLPLSSEFLSALSELEAALLHLNDVAKAERGRAMWAN